MGTKSKANDFTARFREIVSDPLNIVIQRDPRAGFVDGNYVYLHNGLKVPLSGPHAYYGEFSKILIINRGVHEPLEEFAFQELIKRLPDSPLMIELGAYWGHYSMWLKIVRSNATVHLVEPELKNLCAGKHNFDLNGISGEFIHAFVSKKHFSIDKYCSEKKIEKIDILHSDIQGYELEMLENCSESLAKKHIDYLFISTHSQKLHHDIIKQLEDFNYRVEISSDYDSGTTSYDGFIFASSPLRKPIFQEFTPMSRVQIVEAKPALLFDYLSNLYDNVLCKNKRKIHSFILCILEKYKRFRGYSN